MPCLALNIIFTNTTCSLPLMSFPQTRWYTRRERKAGEKKNSLEIKFYLPKPQYERVCVCVCVAEARCHVANLNL